MLFSITDSPVSKSKDGIFGNFGITAMIGIFAGVFLATVVVCVAVFFLFRKVQKTTNSQTASIPGSRPVSMENGSLAVSKVVTSILNLFTGYQY